MNRIHATVPSWITLQNWVFEAFETHAPGKLAEAITLVTYIWDFLLRTSAGALS